MTNQWKRISANFVNRMERDIVIYIYTVTKLSLYLITVYSVDLRTVLKRNNNYLLFLNREIQINYVEKLNQ